MKQKDYDELLIKFGTMERSHDLLYEQVNKLRSVNTDLLEACKALLKIVKHTDREEWCIQIALADEAIAKAEGKEDQ